MNATVAAFIAIAVLMVAASLAWMLRPLLARQVAVEASPGDRRTGPALMLAIACAAALLYAQLGNLEPLRMPAEDVIEAKVDRMVARLAAHLVDQPADAGGWRLLARSYDQLGRLPDATRAWTRLVELEPGNADALADLANALSMEQSGRFAGEPIRRARQALALDPANAKALAMVANEASERRDFDTAIDAWERLRALVPQGSDVMKSIDENLAAAREEAGR